MRAAIRRIPKGKVATYGDVARAAGHEGAARQVAWALHNGGSGAPWHRVLGAGGRILLRGENALEQRLRLESEGVRFEGGRVCISEHRYDFKARPKASATRPTGSGRSPRGVPGARLPKRTR